MRLRQLWDYGDAKRGAFLGILSGLLYYIILGSTSIFGYYDKDFDQYIQPYGRLWYLLNPYFQNWQLYSLSTALIYIAVLIPQIWLARKGKLSKRLLLLNVMTVIFFRRVQSSQDITVVMFAPLASINPLFSILLIAQKMAIGWSWNLSDPFWHDWWAQTHNDPFQVSYFFLIFWFIVPLGVWFEKWWKIRHMKPVERSKHCGDCWSTGCTDDHCNCCDGGRKH